jgi:hypothetical protein
VVKFIGPSHPNGSLGAQPAGDFSHLKAMMSAGERFFKDGLPSQWLIFRQSIRSGFCLCDAGRDRFWGDRSAIVKKIFS